MITLYIVVGLLILLTVLGHFGLTDKSRLKNDENAQLMDERAADFFHQGSSEIGFLLVHGYGGTPFTVSFLGEYLAQKGHSVIAPRLPGHGTNIEDFHKARYSDWLNKVEKMYLEHRVNYRYFFVVGFSLGGNLCLRMLSQLGRYRHPSGLVLISAPIILNGFLNGKLLIRDFKLLFSGIIKYFITQIPKRLESPSAMQISPWIGYNWCHSTTSVHSVKLNIPKVKKTIAKLRLPIAVAHAQNDKTVNVENSYYVIRKAKSRIKKIFIAQINDSLTSCHRIITHVKVRQDVFEFIHKFVEEVLAKEYLHQLKIKERA